MDIFFNLININHFKKIYIRLMRFTFSAKFRQDRCHALLKDLGSVIDDYRLQSGCNVKEMMAELHISHPVLKKY